MRFRCLAMILIAAAAARAESRNAGALVLVNSASPAYNDFAQVLEPYLAQFGVPYEVRDLARSKPGAAAGYALIIVGHRELDPAHRFLSEGDDRMLAEAIYGGTGLVSFDGLLYTYGNPRTGDGRPRNQAIGIYRFIDETLGLSYHRGANAREISIGACGSAPAPPHFITALQRAPRISLKRAIPFPGVDPPAGVSVLACAAGQPALLAATAGKGRAVLFTSYDWVRPDVKGRVYGMDDLVWRSLVWAARKPFVLRGMPHFLAFRVDDVAGFGLGSNRNLGFVDVANKFGLIPWLGVFFEDLRENPAATQKLSSLARDGKATAFVHARRWPKFFYWNEPLWTDDQGRNVAGRPWTSAEMAAAWEEADAFFRRNRIPYSKVALPHFYEFAPNNFAHLAELGVEFTGTVLTPGQGYGSPVPPEGPYLSVEPPRASNAQDPLYLADWLRIPGHPEWDRRFFNFVLEVRDVTGYEWAPSHVPVSEAIRRGVAETLREWDSLLPGVLFTHESDHIQYIQPDDWDRILQGLMDELRPYKPVPVTLDDLSRYLRALKTSRLVAAQYDPQRRQGRAEFEGSADVAIRYYVFESDDAPPRELEVPAFQGHAAARW